MRIPNALALWRPALNQDNIDQSYYEHSLAIDDGSIILRTGIVTAAAIVLWAQLLRTRVDAFVPIMACMITPYAWRQYDHIRAAHAINKRVVDLFMEKETVPDTVMDYMTTHPSAVRMLLKRPGALEKLDSSGDSLFENVLRKREGYSGFDKEQNLAAVSKMFIDKRVKLSAEELLKGLKSEVFDVAIHALKSVDAKDFTPEETFKCWTAVKDERLAQLLAQKRFDINAKDAKGRTPLVWAIENHHYNIQRICMLLKHGAAIPDAVETKIEVKKIGKDGKEQVEQKTLEQFLQDKPLILAAFKQARKDTFKLPEQETSLFALWKPAVTIGGKYRSFEVSGDSIFIRAMMFISWPIMMAAIGSLASRSRLFYATLPFAAVPFLYHRYEWSRAAKVLNELAVKEFQNPFPSSAVTKYIVQDMSLIDQLIAKNADLAKMNEEGKTLLQTVCDDFSPLSHLPAERLAAFEKLAEASQEQKYPYLISAIKQGKMDFVTHLLGKKIIKASDLTGPQQFACWMAVRNSDQIANLAEILDYYHINVNAQNDKKYTPLLEALSTSANSNYQFIKELLKRGADLDATVEIVTKDDKGVETKTVKVARTLGENHSNPKISKLFLPKQ